MFCFFFIYIYEVLLIIVVWHQIHSDLGRRGTLAISACCYEGIPKTTSNLTESHVARLLHSRNVPS